MRSAAAGSLVDPRKIRAPLREVSERLPTGGRYDRSYGRSPQLNFVTRQRAKPHPTSAASIATINATPHSQRTAICGARAERPNPMSVTVAAVTMTQSAHERLGAAPVALKPSTRALVKFG